MSAADYALLAAAIGAAYAVFGLTGFGAAMVAVPVLVQFMPLQLAVPLVLLMDLVSTAVVGLNNRVLVARAELARLGPVLLFGVFLGAGLLATVDSRWLLIVLGVFVIGVALRGLLSRAPTGAALSAWWVLPAGAVGGIFSGLFGTGGPIYTLYLARRLAEPERFRATMSAVIFVSALARIAAFAIAGLLLQRELLMAALFALPFCLLGLAFGSRARLRFSPEALKRAVLLLLVAGGAAVLARGLAGS